MSTLLSNCSSTLNFNIDSHTQIISWRVELTPSHIIDEQTRRCGKILDESKKAVRSNTSIQIRQDHVKEYFKIANCFKQKAPIIILPQSDKTIKIFYKDLEKECTILSEDFHIRDEKHISFTFKCQPGQYKISLVNNTKRSESELVMKTIENVQATANQILDIRLSFTD